MTDLTGVICWRRSPRWPVAWAGRSWTEYGYVHYRRLNTGTKYAVNLAFDDNMVIRVLKLLRCYGPEEAVNLVLDQNKFVEPYNRQGHQPPGEAGRPARPGHGPTGALLLD